MRTDAPSERAGGESPSADAAAAGRTPRPAPDPAALLDVVVAHLSGERRDGQHAMADAVADAIVGDRHLLVQAGTGTGKSLGYLVPAVDHAVRTDERVVISTATLALQRQVLTRDLPAVTTALEGLLPRRPRVAVLKGWHNYVCRHKVAGGYPEDSDALFALPAAEPADDGVSPEDSRAGAAGPLGAQVVRVREWANGTPTGDRDDLVPGVSDRAWRQVSVTALECLGPTCRQRAECFASLAREAARESDVVVTNHAILGIAASGSPGVLPDHEVLVIDEAHELADRVTAQATVDLSAGVVENAARLARRHGGVATAELDAAGVALEGLLTAAPEGRLARGLPDELRAAVTAVAAEARVVLSGLTPGSSDETAAGVKSAQAAMLGLFETADRMAPDEATGDVLWIERPSERGGSSRLRAAPLSVTRHIREGLLDGRRAVLTSATLTLGGTFDALARSVGLSVGTGSGTSTGADDRATEWVGIDVGSPFDYPRQGILYVARSLPPPTREGAPAAQHDEIAALVEAADGRTLGLFSSRRAAVAAALAMRERVPVPVLCQGDDQLPTLVRRFMEDEQTCLFGTLSLWQGVDVPGATCRLVLIDRLPFPRPDDPVRSARAEAVDAGGGNGFMAVSAQHAALLLAQGAGRLIRSTADRGVVAVLDSRLATARYGSFLVRSLPPFWRTEEGAVARAALRRLAASS